ncbi:MAG: HipA family kinase [Verrucomicrobiota bacterium]
MATSSSLTKHMPVTKLIAIHGRSATGVSRPFLCEGDQGQSFVVKSRNVGSEQLVMEYLLAHLAEEYGLPVAPFELVDVPPLLADHALVTDAHELSPGPAFGSQAIPFADDLRESHLAHIPDDQKIACLCFDWWVSNSDRRLEMLGSGSNLLWDPGMQSLVVIDHDRALDPHFDADRFKKTHAFRDVRPFIEKPTLDKLRTKFESAIYNLKEHWNELPKEWVKEMKEATGLTRHKVETQLLKPKHGVDTILPA